MYCPSCGLEVARDLPACSSCGQAMAPEQATALPANDLGERLMHHARSTSQDAWRALKILALDPVGGLRPVLAGLSPEQARNAAVAFAIAFDLCVALGGGRTIGFLRGGFGGGGPSFGALLALVLVGLVPILTITGALALARKLSRTTGGLEGDLFVAGTALLPAAACLLFAAFLGIGNFEVLSILAAFAFCYSVILVFTGFREIAGLASPRAAVAVPIVLLVSLWVSKIVVVALL